MVGVSGRTGREDSIDATIPHSATETRKRGLKFDVRSVHIEIWRGKCEVNEMEGLVIDTVSDKVLGLDISMNQSTFVQ